MNIESKDSTKLKPMYLGESLLYFGVPAVITVLCVFRLFPYLVAQGFSTFVSYMIALDVPLGIMLITSLVAYWKEGNPINWPSLRDRFRLKPMDRKGWIWTFGLFVFMLVTAGALSSLLLPLTSGLIDNGLLTIPENTPSYIDPSIPQSLESLKSQIGVESIGNLSLVLLTIFSLILNILGEEFLWRGYVLPRQELAHGKNTWMTHGVMWTLLHVFKWWQMFALLPGALALSFVVQRFQNTWPGIIAHLITNGIGMAGVILVILGLAG